MAVAEHLTAARHGVITQGTIFSCATAEDYTGCQVHGLVITARCDIAQTKAAVFNYLPVVTLDDWIHRDGRLLLCERIGKNIEGRMRACLRAAGHSESIMITERPEAILRTLFPAATPEKEVLKRRKLFQQAVEDYGEVIAAMEADPSQKLAIGLGNKHAGDRDAVIRELISHRLNGYYFLASISADQEPLGHVVLLREVRHMPRDLAGYVANGINADEYISLCKGRSGFLDRLSFETEDFAMPVSSLRSPHIEHLMQVFSILFSRIGLPDPDREFVETVWHKQPSVGEAK
jgi:hypothetical protein